MLDARGDALYVGKAKSLKKRVPAYTKVNALSQRLRRMVALTRQFDVVTTTNEVEALLLECNMIKRLRPAFNILLRDDKSFPYIYLGKPTAAAPLPADWPASRREEQEQGLFRTVRVLGCGQRDPGSTAARLSASLLRRQHFFQPHASLSPAPDQALHGALRRPNRARRLCRAAGPGP